MLVRWCTQNAECLAACLATTARLRWLFLSGFISHHMRLLAHEVNSYQENKPKRQHISCSRYTKTCKHCESLNDIRTQSLGLHCCCRCQCYYFDFHPVYVVLDSKTFTNTHTHRHSRLAFTREWNERHEQRPENSRTIFQPFDGGCCCCFATVVSVAITMHCLALLCVEWKSFRIFCIICSLPCVCVCGDGFDRGGGGIGKCFFFPNGHDEYERTAHRLISALNKQKILYFARATFSLSALPQSKKSFCRAIFFCSGVSFTLATIQV